MNYVDIIEKIGNEYGDKIAIKEMDKDRNILSYSYNQFVSEIKNGASYIQENGYKDMVVAVIGNNSYNWLVSTYACLYVNTTVFVINPEMEVESLKRNFLKTSVKLILADDEYFEKAKSLGICDVISMKELASFKGKNSFDNIEYDLEKTACLMCSSGTTGKEKIVMLSGNNMMSPFDRKWETGGVEEELKMYWTLPFFHVGFISFATLFCMGHMMCIGNSPKYFLKDMKIYEPHSVSAIPMLCNAIAKKLERGIALSEIIGKNCKIISCGAAVLSEKIIDKIISSGCIIGNNYGLTESSSLGTANTITPYNKKKMNSVGRVNSSAEIDIVDGEIVISGKGVMKGYYDDEELTAMTIRDGWLYTGDMGYIDEEGYLYIKGRKKNVIITESGENILPEEIEKFFVENEVADEVLVYDNNNVLTAEFFIGRRKTTEKDVEELVGKYNKENPVAKNIRSIKFRNTEFEKTGTGKIKRNIF